MAGEPVVRDAADADNPGLLELARSCPMVGDIAICIERDPTFATLNALEGTRFRIGVVAKGDHIAGAIAVAWRTVMLNGKPTEITYVGDFKVAPSHRGDGTADALSRWAEEVCLEDGRNLPSFLTILSGNASMHRRLAGPRGLPELIPRQTIRNASCIAYRTRTYSGPLLVDGAREEDADEMDRLWNGISPSYHLMRVYQGNSLAAWIAAAPSLGMQDFILARDRDGTLLGFLGLWEQTSFKRLRITSYSRQMDFVRHLYNGYARITHGSLLPGNGAILPQLNAVACCIPQHRSDVLSALLAEANNRCRKKGFIFFNIGIAAGSPLLRALAGYAPQFTDIDVCEAVPNGGAPRILDDLLFHHEIALV